MGGARRWAARCALCWCAWWCARWWGAARAQIPHVIPKWGLPPVEVAHQYWYVHYATPSPWLEDGSSVPNPYKVTPDFRVPEQPHLAYTMYKRELNRPFRLSPHNHQHRRYDKWDCADNMGCACCMVYKRLTPLAACAVITTRHFLTTASAVELVLQGHRQLRTLENVLGAWYDHNWQGHLNSSMYMSFARVHYHPRFLRPHLVNRSHPLPNVFDLAVLASTYNVYGYYGWTSSSRICPRATSSHPHRASAEPSDRGELWFAVGFQFMWAFRRVPSPFHKYFVRTRDYTLPCPKVEWGWFVCFRAHHWARHGFDSGGSLFRTNEKQGGKRWEGLLAMHSMALTLRTPEVNLYFTVLDSHPVLDFLYKAYTGRMPYEWLDYRFFDTQWAAPRPRPWAWIRHDYTLGKHWYFSYIFW